MFNLFSQYKQAWPRRGSSTACYFCMNSVFLTKFDVRWSDERTRTDGLEPTLFVFVLYSAVLFVVHTPGEREGSRNIRKIYTYRTQLYVWYFPRDLYRQQR